MFTLDCWWVEAAPVRGQHFEEAELHHTDVENCSDARHYWYRHQNSREERGGSKAYAKCSVHGTYFFVYLIRHESSFLLFCFGRFDLISTATRENRAWRPLMSFSWLAWTLSETCTRWSLWFPPSFRVHLSFSYTFSYHPVCAPSLAHCSDNYRMRIYSLILLGYSATKYWFDIYVLKICLSRKPISDRLR